VGNESNLGKPTVISRARIEEVDAKYPSVKERAEEVWAFIQIAGDHLGEMPSMYDITCFSCQWLGSLALGQMSENEDFVELAKEVNRWLNSVHYSEAEEIFGERERKRGETDTAEEGTGSGDGGSYEEAPGCEIPRDDSDLR
jgi:hypothetical protein